MAQAQFIFTDLSYGNFDSADMRDAVFEQVVMYKVASDAVTLIGRHVAG